MDRQDLDALLAHMQKIGAWERRSLATQGALGLLWVGAAVGLGAWAAPLSGLGRPSVLALGAFGGGAALWWVGLQVWLRWGPAVDPVRQARRVEALEPALQGRLITVVERPDGPRPGEREDLFAWVAHRAAPLALAVTP